MDLYLELVNQLQDIWALVVAFPPEVWVDAFMVFVGIMLAKKLGLVRSGGWAAGANVTLSIIAAGGFASFAALNASITESGGTAVIAALYYLTWTKGLSSGKIKEGAIYKWIVKSWAWLKVKFGK